MQFYEVTETDSNGESVLIPMSVSEVVEYLRQRAVMGMSVGDRFEVRRIG